jgi:hypothetical protein
VVQAQSLNFIDVVRKSAEDEEYEEPSDYDYEF